MGTRRAAVKPVSRKEAKIKAASLNSEVEYRLSVLKAPQSKRSNVL